MSFDESLAYGKVGESIISRYMQSRGHAVLPGTRSKRPWERAALFSIGKWLIAPDMLVFTASGAMFIEAKHKSVFTWHRASSAWTTGIDLRHYGDYLRVAKETRLPVWFAFYHRESIPSESDRAHGCPSECPTGLYVGELFDLLTTENHRSKNFDPTREGFVGHGKSGMVYWAESTLKKIASNQKKVESAISRERIAA